MSVAPQFFSTPADWRAWLEANHLSSSELLVGFHKVSSGLPSMTWAESVDVALCFGWIDGVRRRIDDRSYSIRFTPRRAGSVWSAVNVARVEALTALGLMHDAGLAAFARRTAARTATYSYEQEREAVLDRTYECELRDDPAALAYFESRPPWYRRAATHWVMSAKREETRRRRLEQLIEESAAGRDVPPLRRR